MDCISALIDSLRPDSISSGEWIQIIINCIYTLATLGLLAFAVISAIYNRRQIMAAIAGLRQSQDQFDAMLRANIIPDIEYIKGSAFLCLKNTGIKTAINVKFAFQNGFLACLEKTKSGGFYEEIRRNFLASSRIISTNKSFYFPLWLRDDFKYIRKLDRVVVIITFECEGIVYENEYCFPLKDEFLIESSPFERVAIALEEIAKKH